MWKEKITLLMLAKVSFIILSSEDLKQITSLPLVCPGK